jgi:hypothetical protein
MATPTSLSLWCIHLIYIIEVNETPKGLKMLFAAGYEQGDCHLQGLQSHNLLYIDLNTASPATVAIIGTSAPRTCQDL